MRRADGSVLKVLAFTCSRDRPVFLRHCILQMRCQSHPVDHAIYVNGYEDTRDLYRDLKSPNLFMHFGPPASYHDNHVNSLSVIPYQSYDLFCKIDDDDIYHTNYIEGVVADYLRHQWDYSGACSDGVIKGRRWLRRERWRSLGLTHFDKQIGVIEVMPSTTAFSRKGIECVLALTTSSKGLNLNWRIDQFEDVGWRRAVARMGLRQHVRQESRFVYHIHGWNVSTSGWLTPGEAVDVRDRREVRGAIAECWLSLGGALGFLGLPLTDESATADRRGRFNHFEGGSIYWTPETGAHEIHGAIADKWNALGAERSLLGYSLTDEITSPDGVGRYSSFEGGSIYWTARTGAHEVHGAIRKLWGETGWEGGPLGYPISDEQEWIPPAGIPGRKSEFEHGQIVWTELQGAWVVESGD